MCLKVQITTFAGHEYKFVTFMKDRYIQLTDEDRAKQEMRRNSPSRIAQEFTTSLRMIGDVQARQDLFVGQVQSSIERCSAERAQGQEPVFYIDTITCPLYRFDPSKPVGDFSAITGVMDTLDEATRYRDKFDRYLATVAQTDKFLRTKGITTKGRVYFGDTGVINVQALKEQFGVNSDHELRLCLGQNASAYEFYLSRIREQIGLEDVELDFTHISEIAPVLKNVPMDLHESVESTRILPDRLDNISVKAALEAAGINSDIARAVVNEAEELVNKRIQDVLSTTTARAMVKKTYQEVVGFLLGYGIAGKVLGEIVKPDVFVSLDLPKSYRNDLYYSYFEGKGRGLAIFTPDIIDQEKRDFLFKSGGKDNG